MKNSIRFNTSFSKKELNFERFRISLASPEQILSWSYGEVKRAETINYRTLKPERDGLFCAHIFGPIKDYECLCGRYKRVKHRGVTCEKCGVDVTSSEVRRERMGHIQLATPVAHIWFLRLLPSRIGLLLNMSLRDTEKVLYFENCVVVNPRMTDLHYGQLLSDEEYQQKQAQYSGQFEVLWGAEALLLLIKMIDLKVELDNITEEMQKTNSDTKLKKLIKRYKLMQSFLQTGNKPEWVILTVLPVLPPDLRPLIPLDNGGRFATSDLNDLYRRVINRNVRLKRLLDLGAPDIIVRNEKRMLQEAVDTLLDNGRHGRVVSGNNNKRPLKSLADMLKGKQGRFRQNLLGKRVDYSGRSVIVVGPELRLHQCGLPKEMALELFKPFVYHKLQEHELANSFKGAKHMVETGASEVWDVLEEVIREHPVLLNRAPTLHRLGIQAFEPILIEGKAIQLHPLVCVAFNADFDGDQMAVHVPISTEAQVEARVLMMSTNNILAPANGLPVINADQDIVLGVYYLSRIKKHAHGEGRVFASVEEVLFAHEISEVSIHAAIKVRLTPGQLGAMKDINHDDISADGSAIIDTSVGRIILFKELGYDLPFQRINRVLGKKQIASLIDWVFRHYDNKRTVLLADHLKEIGFKYATRSGLSVGLKDFVVPEEKSAIIEKSREQVTKLDASYAQGLITGDEKYNKIIDIWSRAGDEIANYMMKSLETENHELEIGGKKEIFEDKSFNPVYIMSDSGARGSAAQIRQLSGMRGLMARPDGSIIENPITSNFRGGLSVNEFFTSTHGARKGLADTALKTASSGYLTRRLVDVAQDLVITEEDCGAEEGIWLMPVIEGRELIQPLFNRTLGRYLAKPVVIEGKTIIEEGSMITEAHQPLFENYAIDEVCVRSVITCRLNRGVCAKCYGRDLGRGRPVVIGESVGVVAAQSIGEPGTQLTMRTFHIGGAASQGAVDDHIEARHGGRIELAEAKTVPDRSGNQVIVSRSTTLSVVDSSGRRREHYRLPYGATLYLENGQNVEAGTRVVSWDPHNRTIIAEFDGHILFKDILDGLTAVEKTDELTGIASIQVLSTKERPSSGKNARPSVALEDEQGRQVTHYLEDNALLNVSDGSKVQSGDVLARVPQEGLRTKDITGGLPRVEDLLEARSPKMPAVLAPCSGVVRFGRNTQERRRLQICDNQGEVLEEVTVYRWRQLNVYEGSQVERGEMLSDGELDSHDILEYMGVDALAEHIVNEVQAVYRLQGVEINDKHIEVIVRQMLRRVEIVHPGGNMHYIKGEQLDLQRVLKENEHLVSEDKEPIIFKRILLGITKASLMTESFISAASFQETTRVLTDAATHGTIDHLVGLKENVMLGRLVPAGTGFSYHQDLHAMREQVRLEQQKEGLTINYQEILEKEIASIARDDDI